MAIGLKRTNHAGPGKVAAAAVGPVGKPGHRMDRHHLSAEAAHCSRSKDWTSSESKSHFGRHSGHFLGPSLHRN